MRKNHNLGKVTKESDGYRLILERTFDHPIQDVWKALTDPSKLKIWFTAVEGDFTLGNEFVIRFDDQAGTVTRGRVITMIEPTLLEYTWEDELASWRLEDLHGKTRLTLAYSRLADNYAADVPAGWHELLDQLEVTLDGRTDPFPFGGEASAEGKKLKKAYRDVVVSAYPEVMQHLAGENPVVVEKTLNAGASVVWHAITRNDQMKQWYFDLPEFRAEPGFVFEFVGGDENRKWKHRCRVIEVIPEKKISYTWEYPGYEGSSLVVWELFADGEKTRLVLSHYGLDSFPASIPEFHKTNFDKGWNSIVGESLSAFLTRQPVKN